MQGCKVNEFLQTCLTDVYCMQAKYPPKKGQDQERLIISRSSEKVKANR